MSLHLPSHSVLLSGVVSPEACPNLADLFDARVIATPDALAVRSWDPATSGWQSCTWRQLAELVEQHARVLAMQGLPVGSRVIVQCDHGPNWVAIEQAIYRNGLVLVGIHALENAAGIAYITQDSQARFGYFSDQAHFLAAADLMPANTVLTGVAMNGSVTDPRLSSVVEALAAVGSRLFHDQRASSTSLASLVYTSGSGAQPRGAMLSHKSLLANVFALQRALPMRADDVALSVLPLSHCFARVASWYLAMVAGAETVFARDAQHLLEDFFSQKPTTFIGVPRVFEKIYARIQSEMDTAPLHLRTLFRLILRSSKASHTPVIAQRLSRTLSLRVQAILGGRLRVAITGGAALSPQISRVLTVLGVPVLQGYGLTEAGPVVSVNRLDSANPESCGPVLDNMHTQIAADGELLIRSDSLMEGYWQDPVATSATIDSKGWLHTGDKVSRLCRDHIYIIGRQKDLLVTSTGQKASPAEIEARITADPIFEHALVVGEARPFLAALVVLNARAADAFKAKLQQEDTQISVAEWEQALLSRIRIQLHEYPEAHQVRRIAICDTWHREGGQLTNTQKLRRSVIKAQNEATIEGLYQGHCQSLKTDSSYNAETLI